MNFKDQVEDEAISPELFVSHVSAYKRKPVTYHVYEDDVVLRSEARRSLASAHRNGGYSSAGMRRRDAGEITDDLDENSVPYDRNELRA